MPTDHIRYDILTQAALRGVVRTVLADAAQKGLPGEHHFKITFATTAPGVRLSERMRAQYPEAMTIILQHQFWDLMVHEEAFEVGLSFGGIPERLDIPFNAVTAFYDPAVQFGFQFEPMESQAADDSTVPAKAVDKFPDKFPGPTSRTAPEQNKPGALPVPPATGAEQAVPAPDPDSGGQVVRLDRFRKK